jgi:hypothetical protein
LLGLIDGKRDIILWKNIYFYAYFW